MNVVATRNYLVRASILLLVLAGFARTADPPAVRAILQPANTRKAAPQFALQDGTGNTIRLKDYQGKVVLLDFWATWCTGCKMEIPWFSEFQETYGAQGFVVVGVSMDEGGWPVVKQFLAETNVPYPMLLGDEPTAKLYEIEALPDTFLIDREGRVAAGYRAGLVDKNDVETNIKALLSKQ